MAELRDYEFTIMITAESQLEASRQFIQLRNFLKEHGWRVTDKDSSVRGAA